MTEAGRLSIIILIMNSSDRAFRRYTDWHYAREWCLERYLYRCANCGRRDPKRQIPPYLEYEEGQPLGTNGGELEEGERLEVHHIIGIVRPGSYAAHISLAASRLDAYQAHWEVPMNDRYLRQIFLHPSHIYFPPRPRNPWCFARLPLALEFAIKARANNCSFNRPENLICLCSKCHKKVTRLLPLEDDERLSGFSREWLCR